METFTKEARECGEQMQKDGLPLSSNPYVMPWKDKEKESWIDGWKKAQVSD